MADEALLLDNTYTKLNKQFSLYTAKIDNEQN